MAKKRPQFLDFICGNSSHPSPGGRTFGCSSFGRSVWTFRKRNATVRGSFCRSPVELLVRCTVRCSRFTDRAATLLVLYQPRLHIIGSMLHLLLHLVLHLLGLDDLLVKVLKSPLSLQPGAEELSALPTTEPGLNLRSIRTSLVRTLQSSQFQPAADTSLNSNGSRSVLLRKFLLRLLRFKSLLCQSCCYPLAAKHFLNTGGKILNRCSTSSIGGPCLSSKVLATRCCTSASRRNTSTSSGGAPTSRSGCSTSRRTASTRRCAAWRRLLNSRTGCNRLRWKSLHRGNLDID